MVRRRVFTLLLLVYACTAQAQETTTYRYDALGRLIESSVAGGTNGGTQTTIVYDQAGNRQRYQVTGSPNVAQPSGRVVVVPLNGFTAIPLASSTF